MSYRITYSPKKSSKGFRTHKIRLLILTAVFFLLFCAYTKQNYPEYMTYLRLLLSKSRTLFRDLMDSILLWSESPGPL